MSYSSWKGYNYLKTQVSAITLLSAFHYLSQWERSEDWVIFKILNIWLKDATRNKSFYLAGKFSVLK